MDKNNKSIFIIIISIALVVISGTFAWLSWRSQNTAMVLTIGDIRGLSVSLKPYQINATLSPVASYTSNTNVIMVDVTADNKKTEADDFKLFYKIDTIDDALKDEGFKYTITKCTANCDIASNYEVLNDAEGNFAYAIAGSNLQIYSESIPANTTYKYKIYLWIDSSAGNQSSMQNKTFTGELSASISSSPYNIMRANAITDNTKSKYVTGATGINFGEISSDTNGKGIYLISETANDAHPIYYYRGEIDNNNVLFAGFCWKMVRTTSTGGTKMVYSGIAQEAYELITVPSSYFTITNDATYPFTYDSNNDTWTSTMHTDNTAAEITFAIKTAGDYVIRYTTSSDRSYDKALFYKGSTEVTNDSGKNIGMVVFDGLTSSDTITVKYSKNADGAYGNDNVVFTIGLKGAAVNGYCGTNSGAGTRISATSKYNTTGASLADAGYMYGTRYVRASATGTGWYYAPDVTYSNGTYTLKAKDSHPVEVKSAINGTNINYQHYTCGSATDTTCETVRYVFYVLNDTTAYYITLADGKKIEDAFTEMFTNTINSTIKTTIDNWYANNMINYTSYLEDTPWCNDRSIAEIGGWNPNGGDISTYIRFGPYQRSYVAYTPSLACNNNDSFTVSANNGNGKLTYPVGLLTVDEVMLAGGKSEVENKSYYLYTTQNWWLPSPDYFGYNNVHMLETISSGYLYHDPVTYSRVVKPAISLKSGTKFSDGNGTPTNPYYVE